MVNLKEDVNNFLFYLEGVRDYSLNPIVTYDNILQEVLTTSHYCEEEKKVVLGITPLRLKNINNSKKPFLKN